MSSLLFGNGTDLIHWQPSCYTRGTFDILSTCTITMLLCVWTAVHLNVPPPGSEWESTLRKVGWLILALLAPEVVAYTAWYQRQQALSIMHKVNRTFMLPAPSSWYNTAAKSITKTIARVKGVIMPSGQGPRRQPTLEAQEDTLRKDRHSWTIMHGFYAIMGGLAIQIPGNLPESEKFLRSDKTETWFLTFDGLLHLLKQESTHGDLPDLSQEEIRSKSKASALAKALVCIQALWFIAQCMTRLAQRIPISLLELNTFGHALCAVLIYVLWWEKPFEVEYPTLVASQDLWDWSALYAMQNGGSTATELINHQLRARVRDEKRFQLLKTVTYVSNRIRTRKALSLLEYPSVELDLLGPYIADDESPINDDMGAPRQESGPLGNEDITSTILEPGQTLRGTGLQIIHPRDISYSDGYTKYAVPKFGMYLPSSMTLESRKAFNELHSTLPHVRLTARDITRWKMASRACRAHIHKQSGNATVLPFTFDLQLLARRCTDRPDWDEIFKIRTILGFTVATFIYGGLHALAWSAHFDSATAKLLWRMSSCITMGGLPVILSLAGFNFWFLRPGGEFRGKPSVVLKCIEISMLMVYMLARAYLVVESFTNVFHLSAGVFETPQWSTYFPHIS